MILPTARLPLLLTLTIAAAMLIHGPIPQLPHYHDFADHRPWLGLSNAADVLSNAGFLLVGLWGLIALWPQRRHQRLAAGWSGYLLFLTALILTAFGSAYYHLAPDDSRLVWDRLPIALACAGLLAAVRAESRLDSDSRRWTLMLVLAAVASVAWWRYTGLHGIGDLRPYLLLQGLPLLLIPLWQTIHRADRADRIAFGLALALYALAKLAELYDHPILDALGIISGHTLKHLFAAAAALILVRRLQSRVTADKLGYRYNKNGKEK